MKSLLVIDDAHVVRTMLGRMLGRLNYQVYFAEDGESAIEILGFKSVDAIILDLHLPYMSGLDCLNQIRQDRRLTHLPIIFLATMPTDYRDIDAVKMAQDSIIQKPIHEHALVDALALLFS